MVNFSDTNTYMHSGRQFIAPADQMGDDHFDLDAFEENRPGPLTPTSDPSALVGALAEKTELLTKREMQAISQLRKSRREAGSLRLQMKGKEHLYQVHINRKRKIINDLTEQNRSLITKNTRYQKHSEECRAVLKEWKVREKTLLSRVDDRNREVEQLKAQMEEMRQAHQARIADLTQTVSKLQQSQETLDGELTQLKQSLSEMSAKNEEYERRAAAVREKEELLASVRLTLQAQLELLVTMSPPPPHT